ncbi:GxxExxY protein [Porphyrobacter sp. CACIAM 03H1]|jgi:iron complex transport system substrate-binding protein|uniref:GxxExxY protein n=1 Tax=Porphyrobacter sp. CACIAM 03H1 TaxID=2003315 RepID=UPI000B5A84FC|nr:GxxExxY protein [Porphyrobacter sp. CACIAM 03H1]ASJ91021.1 Fe3+ hydroxamate ABC transporter substrate-binding protein [Porphyrobacter sp. CACIAM 03H1]
MARQEHLEEIARRVVDCGYHLHRDLGPGLLESAYEVLMQETLRQSGLHVQRQVAVPLKYKGVVVDNAFKIDLLVENQLVVELKSVEKLSAVHGKQVLTYLRLMDLPLGLLMNFGQAIFKDGLRRIANDYFGEIGKQ